MGYPLQLYGIFLKKILIVRNLISWAGWLYSSLSLARGKVLARWLVALLWPRPAVREGNVTRERGGGCCATPWWARPYSVSPRPILVGLRSDSAASTIPSNLSGIRSAASRIRVVFFADYSRRNARVLARGNGWGDCGWFLSAADFFSFRWFRTRKGFRESMSCPKSLLASGNTRAYFISGESERWDLKARFARF